METNLGKASGHQEDNPLRDKIGGEKTFEWVLIPRYAGEIIIPKVQFSYFDPDKQMWDTQATTAVQNALNKLSGDVNVVYIDKDWPGSSNYAGADTATLQAAAQAISSGALTGDAGATGAIVFSGGGKYYVHNPRNRKNYRGDKRIIPRKED